MADNGAACPMRRLSRVWDTAAMESFFYSLKTERIARRTCRSRNQAREDVFDYVERFTIPRAGIRPWAISAPWTSRSRLM
jgi:putative transposase